MMRGITVAALLLLPLVGFAKKPDYNPSGVWPRDFGTGGEGPHEPVEEAFVQDIVAAGGGLVVVDPRLSAVADSIAIDELTSAPRTGAQILQQRRYEGAPQVVVPELKRFTMAHRAVPDGRRWARQLGVQDAQSAAGGEQYTISAANGLTVGVGSARDGRQRHWVLLVGQGRFTMDDVLRPVDAETPWSIEVPDVQRVEVYWRPDGDRPLGGYRGEDSVEVTLPAGVDAISVIASKANKRFEVARLQISEPEIRSWDEEQILADLQRIRGELKRPELQRIDVLPCSATNLADGTPLSGDRTCWTFPAAADGTLWSELRAQPHLWAELVRADRAYVALAQGKGVLELQLRSRFEPVAPEAVKAEVLKHRKLAGAEWIAAGGERLDERLQTMRGGHLSDDAARIRTEVLDADPLFTSMGTTSFAIGYGPRLDGALDMATRQLDRAPDEVAVGYRELHDDKLGYLHVVAVAAHQSPR